MSRILAIDYGSKRTGLAVTDPLRIIATGLKTVATQELIDYLGDYIPREEVGCIVVGEPRHADGTPTKLMPEIVGLIRKLNKLFPDLEVILHDEAFSSSAAQEVIRRSGVGRKKRREKGLVDKMAAVLILQDYLEETKYRNRS